MKYHGTSLKILMKKVFSKSRRVENENVMILIKCFEAEK